MTNSIPKTDAAYWNAVWQGGEPPASVRCSGFSRHEHIDELLHGLFTSVFAQHFKSGVMAGKVLLEAGCGGSRWLPYFAHCHGLQVKGVDYSPEGCALARSIAARARVEADIRELDLFEPPETLRGVADIVYSAGLVEHFDPIDTVLEQLETFVRPGGLLISIIPNLQGINGMLGRVLNKDVMAMHVEHSTRSLRDAHLRCGLTPLATGYLGTINLPTMSACYEHLAARPWFPAFSRLMSLPTNMSWLAAKMGVPALPSALFSPFLYCAATPQTAAYSED